MGAGYFGNQLSSENTSKSVAKETAYDRIMRTGELRCGYVVWPPILTKDPNTGELSGMYFDFMEEIAKRLSIKVIWQEEISFSTFLKDIQNGRYDAECSGGWPTPDRGKQATYSDNLFYLKMAPFVRHDDMRFDYNVDRINALDITVVGAEGENSILLKRVRFPKAKELALPQILAGLDQSMMNVSTHKADVTFIDTLSGHHYMKENPNKIRMVQTKDPIKLIPQNLTLPLGDYKFKGMIDITIEEMLHDGTVSRILNKYEFMTEDMYLPVAKPYESME